MKKQEISKIIKNTVLELKKLAKETPTKDAKAAIKKVIDFINTPSRLHLFSDDCYGKYNIGSEANIHDKIRVVNNIADVIRCNKNTKRNK